MRRSEAIEQLRSRADDVRRLGASALYLFGSTARDEAGPDSDIDVFVDYDLERFSFVELFELEAMLSSALAGRVEVGTRKGLHPLLRSDIEHEAIRIF